MRPTRPFALSVLLALVPALAWAQSPFEQLARTTALTAADDFRIGKGYIDMAGWMWGRSEDPALVARVEALTRRIVLASDRPDLVFNVIVTGSAEVNAAALPGGFLLIHEGIVAALPEDELAFVIGHEIAHVLLRHYATTMNMTQAMQVVTAGTEAHAHGDERALHEAEEQLGKMATRYARNLELEADLYGMLYAIRAGFPAKGGAASMRSMQARVGEIPAELADHANHPPFSVRIEELERGLQTIVETHGLFGAGVAFAHSGESDAAAAAFQQFLTIFPKSSAAWSNLGMSWLQLAIRNAPPDAWVDELPLYHRPDVVVRQGLDAALVERARDALGRSLAIDPNRDAAYAGLAVLARRAGDRKGARALLDKALTIDADFAGFHNNLGVVLADDGDWKGAEAAFRKARGFDGANNAVRHNLAVLFEKTKRPKEAIPLWRELEKVPRFVAVAAEHLRTLGELPSTTPPPAQAGTAPPRATNPAPSATATPSPRQPEDRRVGELVLGMKAEEVRAKLGTPTHEDSVDDGYYSYLAWVEAGVSAVIIDGVVDSLTISDPCRWKTGQGISLGSGRDEVKAAYGPPDFETSDDAGGLLAYDQRGSAFYFGPDLAVYAIEIFE